MPLFILGYRNCYGILGCIVRINCNYGGTCLLSSYSAVRSDSRNRSIGRRPYKRRRSRTVLDGSSQLDGRAFLNRGSRLVDLYCFDCNRAGSKTGSALDCDRSVGCRVVAVPVAVPVAVSVVEYVGKV